MLNWYERLIALRRTNPALHSGSMTMLNKDDPSVLAYVRSAGSSSVLVVLNCTSAPQTVSLDMSGSGVAGSKAKTLMTDDPSLEKATALKSVTVAPYATWIASVE
jgi:glycosidase